MINDKARQFTRALSLGGRWGSNPRPTEPQSATLTS